MFCAFLAVPHAAWGGTVGLKTELRGEKPKQVLQRAPAKSEDEAR